LGKSNAIPEPTSPPTYKKGGKRMPQIFGYQNISGSPLRERSQIRPDFQPIMEYLGNDAALFWGGNLQKQKKDFVYDSSELLVILVGNIYLKENFYAKYPEFKKIQGQGNAAKVANLYCNYGHDEVLNLTGDFILIIKDKKSKKLILIRDKMGGRKLYFTVQDGNIIFSSKLKTLLMVPGVSREIDYFALESFLKFGYIISPATIFKSIRELEPGHFVECGKGTYKVVPYWRLHSSSEIRRDRSAIREILYKRIEENIYARFNANERIGIYLSGGIDSNTLLAFLSKISDPSKIQTMSIGYGEEYKDYHELNQARLGAGHFGSNHHELINGPEHIDKYLCRMVWQFEQPFGNPALISWVSLSDLAKNLVDVVFVGAGADEVLGGYKRYNALNFLQIYYKIPFGAVPNKILKSALSHLSVGANHYNIIYRIRNLSESVQSDILKTNEALLFGGYDDIRENLFLPNFQKTGYRAGPSLAAYYLTADTSDPLRQIFITDCYTDLVSEQLTRALIPLAECDIDYRAPFSDPDFMEFCLNIPNQYKADLFRTKIVYKEAVRNILPEQIIIQKKRGMSHPISFWFQGTLYESLMSILSFNKSALKNYFDMNYLLMIGQEHYSKKRNWGGLLWKMVVFSMWHKIFMENKFTSQPDFSLKDIADSVK
jgi:asparagine synthase (glutamine-hydrolysing)